MQPKSAPLLKACAYHRRPASTDRRGIALVIVLAFVVLLTGLVVAFFTRALTARQVSNAELGGDRSDTLARSSLDIIVGDLKQEIVAGSDPSSPSGVYRPNPANTVTVLPARLGVPVSAATTSPIMPNLMQRSVNGNDATAKPPATGYDPAKFPAIRASAVNSTTDPSLNGRSITPTRWNRHYLLPLAATPSAQDARKVPDTTPVSSFTAPDWVMVTRQGPKVFGSYTTTLAQRGDLANYVVGRYAYAVYNEGGLLNLNVAGRSDTGAKFANGGQKIVPADVYPMTPNADYRPNGGWSRKGTLAFADFEQIGKTSKLGRSPSENSPLFGTNGNAISPMTNMVDWRNYATIKSADGAGDFMSLFTSGGFDLQTVNTRLTSVSVGGLAPESDRAFFSRRQMIDQMLSYYVGTTASSRTTPMSGVQDNLQLFGTFSREKNAPTFRPAAPTAINPDFLDSTVRFQNAGSLRNYAISGKLHDLTTTGQAPAIAVKVGDPIVRKRFSLRRLEWLTYQGPKTGVDAQAIATHFGLKWYAGSAQSDKPSYTEDSPRWIYVSGASAGDTSPATSATASATKIKTLAEVAAETPPREPDFFELLKAGVLDGSLGKHGGPSVNANDPDSDPAGTAGTGQTYSLANTQFTDANPDIQIIRIGANIIDQADTDSFPTTIAFRGTEFYGVENLPYLNKMVELSFWDYKSWKNNGKPLAGDTPPNITVTDLPRGYVAFEMWNPHRVPPKTTASIPSTAAVAVPTNFRVALISDTATSRLSYARPATTPATSPRYAPDPFQRIWSLPWFVNLPTAPQILFDRSSDRTGRNFSEPAVLAKSRAAGPMTPESTIMGADSLQLAGLNYGVPTNDPDWVTRVSNPDASTSGGTANTAYGFWIPLDLQSAVFAVQYQGARGWQTYHTFAGQRERAFWGTGLTYGNYNSVAWRGYKPTPYGKPGDTGSGVARGDGLLKTDPRTSRFGVEFGFLDHGYTPNGSYPFTGQYVDNTNGGSWQPTAGNPGMQLYAYQRVPKWLGEPNSAANIIKPMGELVVNSSSGLNCPERDLKRPRPADGYLGAVAGASPYSNPFVFASGANDTARPVILDRPFRSVGELGYVFRDSPWKTLDFFSNKDNNPDSGFSADAGLLDLFSINDNEIVADRVDLNTRNADVLKALIANTTLEETVTPAYSSAPGATPTYSLKSPTNFLGADVDQVTNDLLTYTTTIPSSTAGPGPLVNRADLVTRFKTSYAENIKSRREVVARSLGEVGTTRTWNLLIDVVAQSGRYTPSSKALKDFLVEGERRYWLHVAIDRYTGEVIDRQLEPVTE